MSVAQGRQTWARRDPSRAARLSVVTAVLFAALIVAILDHLAVVQGVDGHVHGWVGGNRSAWSVSVGRTVTWGGSTAFVLPALFAVGAISPGAGGLPGIAWVPDTGRRLTCRGRRAG